MVKDMVKSNEVLQATLGLAILFILAPRPSAPEFRRSAANFYALRQVP